jgi:choline dehydrogenase
VKLRSADPRDTPFINFHYFEEGTDKNNEDLNAIVDGLEFIQQINQQKIQSDISAGALYGDVRRPFDLQPDKQVKSRQFLTNYVRNESWGHHASCSNKMGPASDPMAVVDNNFKVHGTQNLRIVDASVFPRIPGYFIVTPIYMISEKASDVILADAAKTTVASRTEPARLTRRALLAGVEA